MNASAAYTALQLSDNFDPLNTNRDKVVIAVDGPAASGKGTLARKLAERLNYAYLDTGALYRAVGLATLEMEGNPENVNDVLPALEMVKKYLTPEFMGCPDLRRAEVSSAASKVAAIPEVRAALLQFQKDFASNPPGYVGGAVLDGRDIGTVICPNADVKFFVTATAEERAKRRFNELQDTGTTYEEVLADIIARDARDQSRSTAPTKQAEDAHFIDTTEMNAQVTLDHAVGVIRSVFAQQIANENNQ